MAGIICQALPSLARRPFLSWMQSSTYLNMMVSSTFCHVRWRLEVITSCSAWSAALGWP